MRRSLYILKLLRDFYDIFSSLDRNDSTQELNYKLNLLVFATNVHRGLLLDHEVYLHLVVVR